MVVMITMMKVMMQHYDTEEACGSEYVRTVIRLRPFDSALVLG